MEENNIKITAIIKTSNSEATLYNTLESIRELDEVFIIDENSVDDTAEIAKEYKAKIIYSNKGELLSSLNQALQEAQGDWIFVINDNEIIPQKLIYEIKKYIESPKKNKEAIAIPLKTFYFGKEIKCLSNKRLLRIFKKDTCRFVSNFNTSIKLKKGKIHKINQNLKLKNCNILSYFENDISKHLTYITEKNKINLKSISKTKFSLFFRPLRVFFTSYFLKGGVFDGKLGYSLCVQKFIEEFCMQLMIMNKKYKGEKDDI